jgi:hypothetical protein
MDQKKIDLANFLRTLADWIDQRQPPITAIKSIKIDKITHPSKDFNAKIKVTEAAKTRRAAGAGGDVDISLDHLNVCEWIPSA